MRTFICIIIAFSTTAPVLAAVEPPKPVSFKTDVAPILARKCLGCHNDLKAESGLSMSTFALLKKGGKTAGDLIIEPGDPDSSHLLEVVRPGGAPRMPQKLSPLSEAEIQTLEDWVRQGATFDGPSETETRLASLVDPLKDLPKIAIQGPTSDPIAALAYSPDGKVLAAAHGREVLLFDVSAGKLASTLADHSGPINAVRISPDGTTLIAAGGRPGMFGAVAIWDLANDSKRLDFRGHADAILAAAIAPDGKTLATASYDRLIKLWDLASGKELRTLKEHTDAVFGVVFSPDGSRLASASADRTAKVWDVATGQRIMTLSDATAELYAVTFGPDGRTVLAGGVDRSIRAWDVSGQEGTLIRSVFAHDAAVLRLIASADGKILYSSGEDKGVKAWDLATLQPRAALPDQSDWPLALAVSPDGSRLAVGRYDGSLELYDPASGKLVLALRDAPGATPPQAATKPELLRNATLNPPSPRGAVLGAKVRVTLGGNGVGKADSVVFADPAIVAAIVPAEKPDPNRLDVDLTIPTDTAPGIPRFWVRTPLGIPETQPFVVFANPESAEAEPNNSPEQAKVVTLPATLAGAIDTPGDVDHVRFEAKAGQTLVFQTLARDLGSTLDGTLAVLDAEGRVLAEALDNDDGLDPVLGFEVPRDGTYALRISDAQFGGSGNHFYRIVAGTLPYLRSAFPLSVQPGTARPIEEEGPNIPGSVVVDALADAEPGSIRWLPYSSADGFWPARLEGVVVAEGVQSVESVGNTSLDRAVEIAVPGGVSGRIDAENDVDYYRFGARKGERLILEVFGRRLGSPIDPSIEVLDARGKAIPRAVLRPVAETAVAFRDHPAASRAIRLTQWNDFAIGDYVLIGRELTRLFELPRNPDDDAVFWGMGNARNSPGERTAFLETTPEQHPLGQVVYKVEIHPPGATFPAGGVHPVTLNYRNDDGGHGLGKDPHLTFDPPADGTYIVRVEDVRGLGGERFGYHLVVRRPRPDFRLAMSLENPNVPRGGTTIVTANVTRLDGFDGPVDVDVEGLPPGVTATSARVESGVDAADLILMADAAAPAFSAPTWRVTGRSGEIRHAVDPGGPSGGWITVVPEPNLKITFKPDRVEIRPGERVEMTLAVERSPAFSGRVPIDVRNLPRGVRVLNIGLNGVLVTETQAERSIFLYAEPWVEPQERPFYAVGRAESAGTDHSSPPIPLIVRPRPAGPQATASVGSP